MENTAVKRSFIKKWKRQNKPLRYLFLTICLAYLISLGFFTFSIIKLPGIETLLRIIILTVFYIHAFILVLGGLILLFTKKYNRYVFLLILTFIYVPILSLCSYHIDKTYNIIDSVQKKYVEYTSVLLSLKDNENIKKIGMISAKNDPTGYIIPQDMIKENKIANEIVEYDDYISMISELYDGEIDAMFVASSYVTMFNTYEKFANIANETKIIYSKTKELENVDNVTYSTKSLTEPFTMLLMGVDSEGDGIASSSSFNGDTLMMITFNPKTLNATVFSIPRDTYVPISCRGDAENKINSSAYGGTSCVVNTIQNLTGIDIDYYVKINFTGVVNLVDNLGGVSLDVPISFCEQDSQRRFGEHLICLEPGYQKLNGEQALALARHRKSLPLGDFQRVQHQQLVVEAMLKEIKNIDSTSDFYKILDDATKNIDTNMSTPQILSMYNIGKNILLSSLNKSNSISIEKTYLTGYDLTMYMDSARSYIYTFQYYKQSLDDIIKLMKENLELEKPELIKTFSFDANEDYEIPVTGKQYYNEKRRELLPNFIGQTKEFAENWARERGIEIIFKEEESTSPNNQILSQTEHAGKLVEKVSSLTITVSKNTPSSGSNPGEIEGPETPEEPTGPEEMLLPDFTGMSIQDFNKWKSSLKGMNLVIDLIELSPEDILTLEGIDLQENTIYKQSHEKDTKLSEISSLKVYYYKKSVE